MPERQHSRLFPRQIARPEDSIGMAIQQRLQQLRIFIRVILQIGVLDNRKVSGRFVDSGPHGGAFAFIHLMPVQPDAWLLCRQPFENL